MFADPIRIALRCAAQDLVSHSSKTFTSVRRYVSGRTTTAHDPGLIRNTPGVYLPCGSTWPHLSRGPRLPSTPLPSIPPAPSRPVRLLACLNCYWLGWRRQAIENNSRQRQTVAILQEASHAPSIVAMRKSNRSSTQPRLHCPASASWKQKAQRATDNKPGTLGSRNTMFTM